MKKIKVCYIGPPIPTTFNTIWGGATATAHALWESFKNDSEIELIYKSRTELPTAQLIDDFLSLGDITVVDDTSTLELMYSAGLSAPDIVGPVDRSPLKDYSGWKSKYTKNWFYKARVIRLNYAEEYKKDKYDYRDKVTLIHQGIDTNKLKPMVKKRKYILWAGMKPRFAKNYKMFEDIMKFTELSGGLPNGYEFKILSKFKIKEYFDILDETAILINTSLYESFCSALYEAQSKGVPTIYRKGLHGDGIHTDSNIQVEYTTKGYYDKIMELLLNNNELKKEGTRARKYVLKTFPLERMNYEYKQIYKEEFNKKYGQK